MPSKSANRSLKGDIIQLILKDHKPLKKLIKIMKNPDKEMSAREFAFSKFAPLLMAHAKPEEHALYTLLKKEDDDDLRVDGNEGDVEHGIADRLIEEVKATSNEDLWTARVKVLAELVEHHIQEEEEDVFPEYKKHSEPQERVELGKKYLQKQAELKAELKEDKRSPARREEAPQVQLHH